jgi:hypothetical protein
VTVPSAPEPSAAEPSDTERSDTERSAAQPPAVEPSRTPRSSAAAGAGATAADETAADETAADEAVAGWSGAGSPPSGLRDPAAAIRGLGAGTLVMEGILLLLAIQPIRLLGGRLGGWGIGVMVGLSVVAFLLSGMMRRRWAWHAGTALQVALVLAGLLHWSLGALGLIFAAVWAYASHVRRTILG